MFNLQIMHAFCFFNLLENFNQRENNDYISYIYMEIKTQFHTYVRFINTIFDKITYHVNDLKKNLKN